MNKTAQKLQLVAAFGFILLASGANEYSTQAQGYAVTTPKIEPAAQAQLDKTRAAYKALTFYASDIKLVSTGLPDNPQIDARMVWQKPNNLIIESQNEAGTTFMSSDGSKMWMTISRAPNQYLEKSVTSSRSLLSSALTEVGIDKTNLGALITGKDPLRQFGSSLQSIELKKVKAGNKFATDRIALVMKTLRRKDVGFATFVIGTKDNLLRSVKIVKTVDGSPVTITETYNNRRVTDEGTDKFVYAATAGQTRVENFQKLPYDPRLVAGSKPFRLAVKDIDGEFVDLDKYKGKVVVLDFWATWCPPCKDDAPRLVALYNKYKDEGLEIIGINMDYDLLNLRPFTKYYGMTWRQTYDGKGWANAIAKRFGVASIPFTLVIGRDGKIVAPVIAQQVTNQRERTVRAALAAEVE